MRRRLLQLALVFFLAPSFATAATPEVQLDRNGSRFAVRSESYIAASAAVAWQVLSDYDHLAGFVPDLRVSRVISAPGQPLLVEQSGEAGFLIFRFSVDVVLEIEEAPPQRLGFRAIRGNMRSMQGEWRIEPSAPGVRLVYTAELEPAFWVPPIIGPVVMRRDIAGQIEAVLLEIERRQAAITSPSTTQLAK